MLSDGVADCQSCDESTQNSTADTVLVASTAFNLTSTSPFSTFETTSPITGGVLSTSTGSLIRLVVFPSPTGLAATSEAVTFT